MAFEFYTQRTRNSSLMSTEPAINIFVNGVGYLNVAATRRFGLEKYSHMLLAWDKQKKLVALKPLEQSEYGAKRLNPYNKCKSFRLSLRGLLSFYKIKYTPHLNLLLHEKDGLLIFSPEAKEQDND
jgi:hypothetical protein